MTHEILLGRKVIPVWNLKFPVPKPQACSAIWYYSIIEMIVAGHSNMDQVARRQGYFVFQEFMGGLWLISFWGRIQVRDRFQLLACVASTNTLQKAPVFQKSLAVF